LQGYYAAGDASTSCTPCAFGNYTSSMASTACLQCLPGTFSRTLATIRCVECLRGTFSSVNAASTCTRCELGKFSDQMGLQRCITGCAPQTQYNPIAVSTHNPPMGQVYANVDNTIHRQDRAWWSFNLSLPFAGHIEMTMQKTDVGDMELWNEHGMLLSMVPNEIYKPHINFTDHSYLTLRCLTAAMSVTQAEQYCRMTNLSFTVTSGRCDACVDGKRKASWSRVDNCEEANKACSYALTAGVNRGIKFEQRYLTQHFVHYFLSSTSHWMLGDRVTRNTKTRTLNPSVLRYIGQAMWSPVNSMPLHKNSNLYTIYTHANFINSSYSC